MCSLTVQLDFSARLDTTNSQSNQDMVNFLFERIILELVLRSSDVEPGSDKSRAFKPKRLQSAKASRLDHDASS